MVKTERITDLIDATDGLCRVLERETEMLIALRPEGIAELQDDKSKLARLHTGMVRDLKAEPALLAATDPMQRAELKSALDRLEQVVGRNQRALGAARAANERLLKAIVEAAAARRPAVAGYGSTGARSQTSAAAPLSLTLNDRF